jgi:hypothetical protein
MAEPHLNRGEKGFGSAEGRSDPEFEQERPRNIIHIDMDAFYASVNSATIRPSGASLSLSAGRGNVVS